MNRYSVFTVTEVFEKMDSTNGKYGVLSGGVKFKARSDRLVLFKSKGVECVTCGVRGEFFALESFRDEPPHLNLYAVSQGREVLMTKDHIFPKSLGGPNCLENYQTMCEPCNGRKADTVE